MSRVINVTERLSGRVALVTGAARGQGRAHAVRLASEGADIIAVDLAGPLPDRVPYEPATRDDLAETARLVRALGRRTVAAVSDIRHLDELAAAVGAAVGELGRLDVIVANAGICIPEPWHTISEKSFRDVIDTNVVGTWNTVMAGVPHMIDGGRGGSVILISSMAGLKMQPYMVHYTASKHAVTGMARAFAAELGPHHIRVNSVHPGPVLTEMGGGTMVNAMAAAIETNPTLNGMVTPFLPQWVVYPEDVAEAVCWLACDESRFITAALLPVDGGMAQF
ncbi:3-ketoacyl-ACP reductase [Mycobacterium kubicae]|uniref:3-ketoacyl-ACP reductase n=1 Tax=Mycobacterium kubicae TaxID=120959 RepID=A0ABQ1BTH9_9MYCO|nr:3-ketoacyl-ACP reductase [Mycobacterium kubicae]